MIAASVASHNACRSSSENSETRSTKSSGSISGWGPMVPDIGSGRPVQEIGKNLKAALLVFFDVELRAGAVTGSNHRNHRTAVISHRNRVARIAADQGIT